MILIGGGMYNGSCQCILVNGITGMLSYFFHKLELNEFIKLKPHNEHYKQLSSNDYSNIIYFLNYLEKFCQFVSKC